MSVDKTRIYRGDTGILAAAAIDLAKSLGLDAARISVDVSVHKGSARVSLSEYKEVRIIDISQEIMK